MLRQIGLGSVTAPGQSQEQTLLVKIIDLQAIVLILAEGVSEGYAQRVLDIIFHLRADRCPAILP